MVWKKLILCIALAVFLAVPITASAADIYDGNISSTYTTIFKDIADKEVGFNEDYVYFRSDQYEYTLAVGKFSIENGVISADGDTRLYIINTESNSYNSAYEYSVSTDSSFNLTVSNQLIYSNLGHYPDLIERSNYYDIATLILLLTAICLYLLRSIFGFSLRLHRQ